MIARRHKFDDEEDESDVRKGYFQTFSMSNTKSDTLHYRLPKPGMKQMTPKSKPKRRRKLPKQKPKPTLRQPPTKSPKHRE